MPCDVSRRCSSMVEHRFRKAGVEGSNPPIGSLARSHRSMTCGFLCLLDHARSSRYYDLITTNLTLTAFAGDPPMRRLRPAADDNKHAKSIRRSNDLDVVRPP